MKRLSLIVALMMSPVPPAGASCLQYKGDLWKLCDQLEREVLDLRMEIEADKQAQWREERYRRQIGAVEKLARQKSSTPSTFVPPPGCPRRDELFWSGAIVYPKDLMGPDGQLSPLAGQIACLDD